MPQHLRDLLKFPPQLLNHFHHEDVLEFIQSGEEMRFSSGDLIIKEDEYVSSAYLIAEGKVSVWKDNIELASLKKGDFLGETFLFSRNNRMANIRCESDCILLKFERHDALNYFRRRPEKLFNIFTKNIIEIQQKKIHNMNTQLLKLKKHLLEKKKW
ncbi:MAG: Crp/Fnr family transcriptional regulator [Balneolaceae bacterium]